MGERLPRLLSAVAWLLLVLAIALGAAGLVSGADHSPAIGARPELTWSRDQEADAALDGVVVELRVLADDVTALGVQARGALAALNGTEISTVEDAIAEGDVILDRIRAETTALHLALARVPYLARTDTRLLVSDAVVVRHDRLLAALDSTTDLQGAWVRLTTGSVAAIRLSALLAQHDEIVTDAASLGRAARYEDAIGRLGDAGTAIESARTLRNQLANTVDVSVLDEWLDRNAAYDAALSGLYRAYARVGSKVTDELRQARAAEAAARRNLPPDPRGLVVIMAEIGRGGMNGAVIAIEQARGRLTTGLDASP